MNNNNYNGEFDQFDVPEGMWSNIESSLEKHDKKGPAFFWWKIAGALMLLAGIGSIIAYTTIADEKALIAENTTTEDERFENEQISEQENVISENNSEKLNSIENDIGETTIADNGSLDSIMVSVPFLTIAPDARAGASTIQTQHVNTGDEAITNATIAQVNTQEGHSVPQITLTNKEIAKIPTVGGESDIVTYLQVTPGVVAQSGSYTLFSSPRTQNPSQFGSISTRLAERQRERRTMLDAQGLRYSISEKPSDQIELNNGIAENGFFQNADGIDISVIGQIGDKIDLETANADIFAAHADSISWEDFSSGSHYDEFVENEFINADQMSTSTFSIDVDGASYSDVRGMINRGTLPNPNAVRIEEFINYFPYEYEEPRGKHPFSIHSEVASCPWNSEHKLVKVGIKGLSIDKSQLPKNNLVFLLDVSGSMDNPEKLDLLKQGFKLLVRELREDDRVSICVYAGAAGVVLPPTSGANKDAILDALNNLSAGGSTAGGEGIELAYKLAEEHFLKRGNNRIVLATDGDFNVGVSDDKALVNLIEEKRKTGVFLTVLGFGHDNFQSSKMEKLANNGNGNFSYIDNILEAKKVLVTEMGATLQTIAKDVKIQLEFNAEQVESYRLIGYENRLLRNEDFANDSIDAGELGAGHTVTALYEVLPTHQGSNTNSDYAKLSFRYKAPDGDESKLIEQSILHSAEDEIREDTYFIQAVTEFGLILRQSKYAGTANFDRVLENASIGLGEDPFGYRAEFIRIVQEAKSIWEANDKTP